MKLSELIKQLSVNLERDGGKEVLFSVPIDDDYLYRVFVVDNSMNCADYVIIDIERDIRDFL